MTNNNTSPVASPVAKPGSGTTIVAPLNVGARGEVAPGEANGPGDVELALVCTKASPSASGVNVNVPIVCDPLTPKGGVSIIQPAPISRGCVTSPGSGPVKKTRSEFALNSNESKLSRVASYVTSTPPPDSDVREVDLEINCHRRVGKCDRL